MMTELKNTPAPGLNSRGTPTPFVQALIKRHSLAASVVCTDCAHSAWILDRSHPRAFCQKLGGMMFGEELQRELSACELHEARKEQRA